MAIIIDFLKDNWGWLSDRPLAALFLVGISALIAYKLASKLKEKEITILKERLELAKEEKERYKSQRDETIMILKDHGENIESLKKRFDEQPKIHVSDRPPKNEEGKNGDIWFETPKKNS